MLSEREQPQRRLVRVPDVVGLPLRKALLLIQQSELRVGAADLGAVEPAARRAGGALQQHDPRPADRVGRRGRGAGAPLAANRSRRIAPRPNTSPRSSTSRAPPAAASGGMYPGVPTITPSPVR